MERKVVADDNSSFFCVDYQPGTSHLNLHYYGVRNTLGEYRVYTYVQ